ncbi:MAG: hypothetical protein QOF58_7077 [Pseudonocardiales bacterium]|jgi:hypothetical protein|nr:hypothetical protein [Pseudonocardiales bacterium]
MPEDLHDFESREPDSGVRGRRHPFEAHMTTAPPWVKVVSRTGAAIWLAGSVMIALGSLGVGQTYAMIATGIYVGGFGLLVALVGMAFHPRPRR